MIRARSAQDILYPDPESVSRKTRAVLATVSTGVLLLEAIQRLGRNARDLAVPLVHVVLEREPDNERAEVLQRFCQEKTRDEDLKHAVLLHVHVCGLEYDAGVIRRLEKDDSYPAGQVEAITDAYFSNDEGRAPEEIAQALQRLLTVEPDLPAAIRWLQEFEPEKREYWLWRGLDCGLPRSGARLLELRGLCKSSLDILGRYMALRLAFAEEQSQAKSVEDADWTLKIFAVRGARCQRGRILCDWCELGLSRSVSEVMDEADCALISNEVTWWVAREQAFRTAALCWLWCSTRAGKLGRDVSAKIARMIYHARLEEEEEEEEETEQIGSFRPARGKRGKYWTKFFEFS